MAAFRPPARRRRAWPAGAEASAEALAAARNQLIHEITRGFYGVLQARAFADVQAESVTSIGKSLRIARAGSEAGSAVRTDVLNLETQLAQANEDLIRARNGLQLAVAALNAGIGADLVAADSIESPGTAALETPARMHRSRRLRLAPNSAPPASCAGSRSRIWPGLPRRLCPHRQRLRLL